ncbi:MAG: hypothetical protein ACO3JG_00390 [Luteolibacter sp.]
MADEAPIHVRSFTIHSPVPPAVEPYLSAVHGGGDANGGIREKAAVAVDQFVLKGRSILRHHDID